MHQKKSKKIFIYFFLLLIFGSINNINLNNKEFGKIKKINIIGLNDDDKEIILQNLQSIRLNNIFLINYEDLNEILNSNAFIESHEIFKKYPSTLNIKIKKTKLLAKINRDGELLFIGSNGKFLKNEQSSFQLPFIFGNPQVKDFLKLKSAIDESNILYEEVKNFYFFPSKRWDLELTNNMVIKLSKKNTKQNLNNVFDFINNENFKDIKIIDARIENQIIIND